MNFKKVLMMSLIILAVLASFSIANAVSQDSSAGDGESSNVIELDGITFNISNSSEFKIFDEYRKDGADVKMYFDEDRNYCVYVYDCRNLDEYDFEEFCGEQMDSIADWPSEMVNGVNISTEYPSRENGGPIHYLAVDKNDDSKTFVRLFSINPNETAKMALSLKFN